MAKGAGMSDTDGGDGGPFEEWFHGIIARNDANSLLQTQEVGSFLVRVAESRFGYSLSHFGRSKERDQNRLKKPCRTYVYPAGTSRVPLPPTRARLRLRMPHTPSCHTREKSPSLPPPTPPNT